VIGLAQSVALALGGVGFSSPLLALRGRVALGLGGGKACPGDVATSSGAAGAVSTSGATVAASPASGALTGSQRVSAATIDDTATSGATAGDTAPEC
jgi:hypothetical protein